MLYSDQAIKVDATSRHILSCMRIRPLRPLISFATPQSTRAAPNGHAITQIFRRPTPVRKLRAPRSENCAAADPNAFELPQDLTPPLNYGTGVSVFFCGAVKSYNTTLQYLCSAFAPSHPKCNQISYGKIVFISWGNNFLYIFTTEFQ